MVKQDEIGKIVDYIPTALDSDQKGKVLVLGWGSTYGSIKSAVAELQKEGHC
jgi:2-oxoglutarate ferredoxin oxidoreductase subunit alpha